MTISHLREKFEEARGVAVTAENSVDYTLVDRFISFIRVADTAGLIDATFAEPDPETGLRFVSEDIDSNSLIAIIDENIDKGKLTFITPNEDYVLIPFSYFEDPEKWEAELIKTVDGFRTKALNALYSVFPKLEDGHNSTTHITVEPYRKLEGNLFRLGVMGSPDWVFAYEGVIYGGRYCLGYDASTDELFYSPNSLVFASNIKVITEPLTQEEIDSF